jgi:hypothetical protein
MTIVGMIFLARSLRLTVIISREENELPSWESDDV